ncbi:YeeE/YedE family protein [Neomegalonema sp.]|uniref:YeeE/YedE family protein n=1 Tax=Neomegalonema sp. TaxID=2039713 RepID=UPI0026316660|nr:YeeE/YedE family protein [Neomegalonema sp.]MDD2869323.1 YeeE/YedE family protein [Neomegalonema sp.]
MTEFTPLESLAGGALIGLAVVLLMALHGRIAGLSGILAGVLPPAASDWPWRAAFLAGAVAAPVLLGLFWTPDFSSPTPRAWLIPGGVLVGIGVFFGSGCTSGHGICGNARLSVRSIAATLTFMATAGLTVYLVRHVFGGF